MIFYDANTYFKDRFGHKMYKASISLNVTCPNRDGSKGIGGCAFCSAGGSGEFATDSALTVTSQIDKAIDRVSKKTTTDTGYIAYFQAFTSTYCSPEYLKTALTEAMGHPKVEAIAIGTRPDCLPDEIIEVLSWAAGKLPLYVELGFQTSSEETAAWFNRGYTNDVFDDAVRRLKAVGINVIAHVIFFLKGESEEQMLDSVRHVVKSGADGIKLTCLYVLKGTRVVEEYNKGEIYLPGMEEYFDMVDKALKIIPTNMVVHRITGDGPKSLLIAPEWTANKRAVINYINRRFGN